MVKWIAGGVAALLALVTLPVLLVLGISGSGVLCQPTQGVYAPSSLVGAIKAAELDAEQREGARLIIAIGVQRGLSHRDMLIALMTSYQESRMRNLKYGDRDSLGLYQQRPSQGWGTPAQILTPEYAINKFYGALVVVKNRDQLSLKEAAMRVQRPSVAAYNSPSNNFDSWQGMGERLLAEAKIDPSQQSTAALSQPITFESCNSGSTDGVGPVSADGWGKPMENLRVGSPYGMRHHPILKYSRLHDGIDIGAPTGTPLYAMAEGTLIFSGTNSGAGNHIKIDHGAGVVVTYMHLSRFAGIAEGQRVEAGQVVGYVGSTGLSTAPHLHLGLKVNGQSTNPVPFLCDRGVPFTGPRGCGSGL